VTIFGTFDGELNRCSLFCKLRAGCSPRLTSTDDFADHDYGCNNGDRTYKFKYESGLAFVDFIGQSPESAMRKRAQAGYGVYGVKVFDFARPRGHQEVPEWEAGVDADISVGSPMNLHSNRTVAVFVLDVRTSKTPWKEGSERYQADYEGDYLGERQWEWFERSIRRSRASVNVVVNGLQVHANRFPDGNTAESWDRYPRAQQRLFDAMLQDGVQSPILVSGDVHMTQLMRKDCARKGDYHARRNLVELTTSGLTHSWGTISTPLSNPQRKPTWFDRYKSFAGKTLMHSLHYLCPWTDVMMSIDDTSADELYENGGGEGATSGLQYSLLQNFGELEFDWNDRTVSLRAIGENPEDPPLLMAKMSMEQLSGAAAISSPHLTTEDFRIEANSVRHRLLESDWVCINHRGRDSTISHMIGHVSSAVVLVTVVSLPLLPPVMFILFLIRRWMQKYATQSFDGEAKGYLPKRGIIKQISKSKRYKTYLSLAKHSKYRLRNISRAKLTERTMGPSTRERD